MSSALEPVVTLWIGSRLGAVERACLRSAMAQGHEVRLYCYGDLDGVPDGVTLRDAREILPHSAIVRHSTGSPALFADHFRYRLQQLGEGIWIDCDAYILAPLRATQGYLFGFESPAHIAVGVLRLPMDSPMLAPLIELFERDTIPPWLPLRWQLLARAGHGLGRPLKLADMPWGSAGPIALTWLAHHHGLARHARPRAALYPVAYHDAGWILDPRLTLEQMIGPETVSLHLWNKMISHFKDQPAPPGSFLARLQAEGAP